MILSVSNVEISKVDPWNPDQYLRFREERRQPFFDLLSLVKPERQMRVIDLGCGTGELTRILHERLDARETLGIDTSDSMLENARSFEGEGVTFAKGDISTISTRAEHDLVFSNAALHWLDDHPALLRGLTSALREGGQLAVQVPANHDHPSYVAAADVAGESAFRDALRGYVRRSAVLTPDSYAMLLHDLGYREQHVRLQIYRHVLRSRADVIEWQKGALLTAYERRMPAELFTEFLDRYRSRLLDLLEDEKPYLFLFKRILFWARKQISQQTSVVKHQNGSRRQRDERRKLIRLPLGNCRVIRSASISTRHGSLAALSAP
jgi:trans-aconitate 2-methyltransferase